MDAILDKYNSLLAQASRLFLAPLAHSFRKTLAIFSRENSTHGASVDGHTKGAVCSLFLPFLAWNP